MLGGAWVGLRRVRAGEQGSQAAGDRPYQGEKGLSRVPLGERTSMGRKLLGTARVWGEGVVPGPPGRAREYGAQTTEDLRDVEEKGISRAPLDYGLHPSTPCTRHFTAWRFQTAVFPRAGPSPTLTLPSAFRARAHSFSPPSLPLW